MGRLKILAPGKSPQAKSQARGKLFEDLMTKVLRHIGYQIGRISNINYSGMEIDIEGNSTITEIPLYAECKCYETDVDSQKVQTFFGKYMAKWFKNHQSQGLFIALPGINSHAKGFYKDNIENNTEIVVRLLEENEILENIFQMHSIVRPETIKESIPTRAGSPGDWLLLYTEKGMFWLLYVVPPGAGIPSRIAIFNAEGGSISEKSTIDYLGELYPEIREFEVINTESSIKIPQRLTVQLENEEIVEVRGSSSCFEYQFPASPEFFVGRQNVLDVIDLFVEDVQNKRTSSRGILFEANSGWGKSSVVLAAVNRLQDMGHFAVAIDSRSASSSQFILRVVEHTIKKFGDFDGLLFDEYNNHKLITGFEGAIEAIINVSKILEDNKKIIFIFLDQFENLFYLPDALRRIRDLFLKIQDGRSNIVLGFSWKTDLIGSTSEFPYQIRDTIASSCKPISLDPFSKIEIDNLLGRLSNELDAPLRPDLKFFLSEYSQGYPWLLKKLCAHVKSQIESGTIQVDIANSLLNIEELFQEDIKNLSPEESDTLRKIAKLAPISFQELGEEFRPEVIQSLVNRRLVVKIGNKFDIYWDIFRDYLNSGHIPIQENYILRTQVGSVLKATKSLAESGGKLTFPEFQKITGLQKNTSYNVLRDAKLLGFIKLDEDHNIVLISDVPAKAENFDDILRDHLHDRLQRNRLIWRLLNELEDGKCLGIDEIAEILEESCPYISATKKTWRTYANIFAVWTDFVDLGLYNTSDKILSRYTLGDTEVRSHRPILTRKRSGITIPSIQYSPIEQVAIRLVEALDRDGRPDYSGMKPSTIEKALITLSGLGFIDRKRGYIDLNEDILLFVKNPEKRSEIFAKSALNVNSFAIFVKIIEESKKEDLTLTELSNKLKCALAVEWKDSTARWYTKIMLNWARCIKIVPENFIIK